MDMAVGIIVGSAFTSIVTTTPLSCISTDFNLPHSVVPDVQEPLIMVVCPIHKVQIKLTKIAKTVRLMML